VMEGRTREGTEGYLPVFENVVAPISTLAAL